MSGKSGAFFDYSEILYAPLARNSGRVRRDCSRKSSPTIEIALAAAAIDRLRVAEPRARPARAPQGIST